MSAPVTGGIVAVVAAILVLALASLAMGALKWAHERRRRDEHHEAIGDYPYNPHLHQERRP